MDGPAPVDGADVWAGKESSNELFMPPVYVLLRRHVLAAVGGECGAYMPWLERLECLECLE